MIKRAAASRKAKPKATTSVSQPIRNVSNERAPAKRGPNAFRAKIRMYRQGIGDCFLVTLPRSGDQDDYHVLIDCGVILGTHDAATTMKKVLQDVATVSKGRIDLLLATHQHWDHLSGFIQAAETFDALDVKNVWMAWTESPNDELAKELAGERDAAIETLRLAGSRMLISGDLEGADELAAFASFFGIAGGVSTQDAIEKVRKKASIRYCYPTDEPIHLNDPDVCLYVLGPPHNAKLIRQREHYFGVNGSVDDWRRIDSGWLDGSSELALALDSATNNTSLVLAIELRDGDVLLFVADAQVGNWLSWQDLKWAVNGREVKGPDLLRRTVFYKVGHHGSHNATLREKGLEQMENLAIAAISVDHDMAVKKRWGRMPLSELIEALREKASKGVLRCDQNPEKPIDGVLVDKLFFEITL
jgi:hypothetical protein